MAANGAMRYVPGSPLTSEPSSIALTTARSTRSIRNYWILTGEHQRRDELQPGMFSIHDVYLVHGSNRNDG